MVNFMYVYFTTILTEKKKKKWEVIPQGTAPDPREMLCNKLYVPSIIFLKCENSDTYLALRISD